MAEEIAYRAAGAALDPALLARTLAYRQIRGNIRGLVQALPAAGSARVPACEDWTVRETVAHLVRNSRVAERGLRRISPRTADTLHRLSLPELFAEWERSARQVEASLGRVPPGKAGSVLVMDAFTHEFDITHALGRSFPPEHPALPDAFEVVLAGLHGALCWRRLPALRLESPAARWTVGEGRPTATVAGEWIDLYRALTGRRTAEQIRALLWSADPGPWLPAFAWGPFRLPHTPVE